MNYYFQLSWNSSDSMDEEYYDGDTKDTNGLDNSKFFFNLDFA